jgi:hypothetical protein
MLRLSRLALIALSVAVMAFFLPEIYWKALDRKVDIPFILYSAVIGEFMFRSSDDYGQASFEDESGNEYSRIEFEKRLPFFYHRDLQKWGELPEEVGGLAVDAEMIRDNLQVVRIEPDDLHRPQIDLYPLFESESIFSGLEYPEEMFRIGERMEFTNARTNRVNEELSVAFSAELEKQGFRFPAATISGNPTTRKPFDEGYFVEDSAGRLFHVKMVQGEPFCRDTGIAPEAGIRYLGIREHARKEFYGTLITGDGGIYLVSYDGYRLVRLPAEHYDPDAMSFQLLTDPINRTLIYKDTAEGDMVYCVLTNRDYKAVKTYEHPIERDRPPAAEYLSGILFPFSITSASPKSEYVLFDLEFSGLTSLAGLLASLAVLAAVRRAQSSRLRHCWVDLAVVALTGFYGLVAATIIVGREPPDPRLPACTLTPSPPRPAAPSARR